MKDAKGHGSNSRGGSYPNIDRSAFHKGEHVGYSNGVWRIRKSDGGYAAVHRDTGASLSGSTLGEISQKLTNYEKPILSVAQSAAHALGPAVAVAAQHGIPTAHLGPGGRDPANSSEERARIYGQRLRGK